MQPQQNPNDRPWTTCADCNRALFVGDEDKDGRCPECGEKAKDARPSLKPLAVRDGDQSLT